MNERRVSTNHKPRPLLNFWELTQKEQKVFLDAHGIEAPQPDEFGELSPDDEEVLNSEPFTSNFFRYRGYVESLADFVRITTHGRLGWTFHLPPDHPVAAQGWQAIHQDGLGMVIKVGEREETVVVGWARA